MKLLKTNIFAHILSKVTFSIAKTTSPLKTKLLYQNHFLYYFELITIKNT